MIDLHKTEANICACVNFKIDSISEFCGEKTVSFTQGKVV